MTIDDLIADELSDFDDEETAAAECSVVVRIFLAGMKFHLSVSFLI